MHAGQVFRLLSNVSTHQLAEIFQPRASEVFLSAALLTGSIAYEEAVQGVTVLSPQAIPLAQMSARLLAIKDLQAFSKWIFRKERSRFLEPLLYWT